MTALRSMAGVAALLVCAATAHAAPRPRIEVTFALDVTGSMGPWIADARSRIKAIADDLASGEPKPEVRFALVAYRDKGDDFVTKVYPFTPDVDGMKKALDANDASGGGDTPEAVLEALGASLHQVKWSDGDQNVVKLLYLVGDAPPHRYPDSPSEKALLDEALRRGIVIHTIACGSMDADGQAFFERMARQSEGRAFRLGDDKRPAAAGAARATSVGAAVSGTARAYSGAVGVDFSHAAAAVVAATPVETPAVETSGLLGAEVRLVPDAAAWSDLWAAHASASAKAPPVPVVDFVHTQVLAIGGADAGLELVRIEDRDSVRVAIVKPAAPGVRFVRVPTAETPVIAREGE